MCVSCKSVSTDYYSPGDSQDIHCWWSEPPTLLRDAPRAFLAVSSTRSTSRWVTAYASVPSSHLNIQSPDELLRAQIWSVCLDDKHLTSDVDVSKLAVHTAGLLASDVSSLVQRATSRSLERVLQILRSLDGERAYPTSLTSPGIISGHVPLSNEDLTSALDGARFSYAEFIGAPKIPNVTWDDVGGLSSVKSDILDTIQLPLERPELFADGLKKRSGMIPPLPTLSYTFLIMARHSPLWPSRHGEDLARKGSCDILFPEFLIG